jgi:hypothetical protein
MQKSALGFSSGIDWGKIDASQTMRRGYIRLKRGNAAGTNPGTVFLGTHEDPGAPEADYDNIPGKSVRQQSFSVSDNQLLNVNFNQTMLDTMYNAGVRGILIGPPEAQNTNAKNLGFYCWFYGVTEADSIRPYMEIEYSTNPTQNLA